MYWLFYQVKAIWVLNLSKHLFVLHKTRSGFAPSEPDEGYSKVIQEIRAVFTEISMMHFL